MLFFTNEIHFMIAGLMGRVKIEAYVLFALLLSLFLNINRVICEENTDVSYLHFYMYTFELAKLIITTTLIEFIN